MVINMVNKERNIVCGIFTYASHYREEIYVKMQRYLNCHLFFGDIEKGKISEIDFDKFSKNGVKRVHTVKLFRHFTWLNKTVFLPFKKYKIYLITGDPFCISSWIILLFNFFLGKQTFLWTHGWYGRESLIKLVIKKIYFALSSGVLLYGDYAKNLMLKQGFTEKKLHVIYNSLHYEDQLLIRKDLNNSNIAKEIFKNNGPIIFFTGRLTEVKKLNQLLEAQKKILEKGKVINVLIMGEGSQKKILMDYASRNETNDFIHFYGECYDEQIIAELYSSALCCVSPGNVGLTAIHAMSYGCPVISHNNFKLQMPEFEAILPGKTGYFFEHNNILDLVSKIELIMTQDRNYLRKECYRIVDEKYNTRYQLKLLTNIINKLN